MEIRQAQEAQYPAVRAFYHSMIDALKKSAYDLGWQKDLYPAPAFLLESIRKGELYLALEGDRIVAAMVLNHAGNDSYRDFPWPTQAREDEVTVLHILGVHPTCARRGIGRQMVQYALAMARRKHQKAFRLDVLQGNDPAARLYGRMGFCKLGSLQMYYENTGWTEFALYEYKID